MDWEENTEKDFLSKRVGGGGGGGRGAETTEGHHSLPFF